MSTRSSAYYENGLHLFHELNYDTLCLDFQDCSDFPEQYQDKQYSSFTMSLEDWEKFAQIILKKVKEMKGVDNGTETGNGLST